MFISTVTVVAMLIHLYARQCAALSGSWIFEDGDPDALSVLATPEYFAQAIRFLRRQRVSEVFGSTVLVPKLCDWLPWLPCESELLKVLHAEQAYWLCRRPLSSEDKAWQQAIYAQYPTLLNKLHLLFDRDLYQLSTWLERCIHTVYCILMLMDQRRCFLMLEFEDEMKWNTAAVRFQARFATPFCLATELQQVFLQDQVYIYNRQRHRVTFSKVRRPLTTAQRALLCTQLPAFPPSTAEQTEAKFLQYWHQLHSRHAALECLAGMIPTAWTADQRALTTPAHLKRWLCENVPELMDDRTDPNAPLLTMAMFRRLLGEHFQISYKEKGAMRCCIVAQKALQIAEYSTTHSASPVRRRKNTKNKLVL